MEVKPLTPTAPMFACEMCPPSAVETAVIESPGFERALSAAIFDTVPDIDWMFTKLQLNTLFADSMPVDSIVSKSSHP